MSTVVCQSIQSCFETQLLSLKLKSPISEPTSTGWASIQDLSSTSDPLRETNTKQDVYVHPSAKRAPMLSDKSLEMCTESLGSETGTTIAYEDFFSMGLEGKVSSGAVVTERMKPSTTMLARKAGYQSLPPPLTTISGANAIRVQPCREGGRLVMTAVAAPPRRSNILVERSNGRLTMSLVEEADDESESGECEEDGVEVEEEEENECDDGVLEECVEDEEEKGCEGEVLEGGRNGRSMEFGVNFGKGEFQGVRRCKEGGRRRLISWERETFWVAT